MFVSLYGNDVGVYTITSGHKLGMVEIRQW